MKKSNKIALAVVVGLLLVASIAVVIISRNNVRAVEESITCPGCRIKLLPSSYCGYECPECNEPLPHSMTNGVCDICGGTCNHSRENYKYEQQGDAHDIYCADCGDYIGDDSHTWNSSLGICKDCDKVCLHESLNSVNICNTCGYSECLHTWDNGTCLSCGLTCPHESKTRYINNRF